MLVVLFITRYRLCVCKGWRSNLTFIFDLAVVALLLLVFFERPSWCYAEKQIEVLQSSLYEPLLPINQTNQTVVVDICDTVPSSKLPRLSRLEGQLIEITLLLIIVADIFASFFVMRFVDHAICINFFTSHVFID
jgi:hypothetical protein